MDSTPHIKRIIDNYEEATASDASYLEQALKDKFPLVAQTESSKSAIEMLAEFSQMNDKGSNNSCSTLSSAEDIVLNMLIKAFVSGLEDQELRHNAISRGATSTGSLLKTYEIVVGSRRALDEIQKQLAQHTAQQKAEAFDEIYRAPQLANSVVARFSDQPPCKNNYSSQSFKSVGQDYLQNYHRNSYQGKTQPQ
ncbi:hypothetical protein GcC1_086023, partial [Golovinomyces cichoracearum]